MQQQNPPSQIGGLRLPATATMFVEVRVFSSILLFFGLLQSPREKEDQNVGNCIICSNPNNLEFGYHVGKEKMGSDQKTFERLVLIAGGSRWAVANHRRLQKTSRVLSLHEPTVAGEDLL
ncbi:hypothetical protein AAC387_Pa06g1907 [Persea americana]